MVYFTQRSKNDLFRFRFFALIFKNKKFVFCIRIITFLIFFGAILDGFINPIETKNSFAVAIFWSFFWPFFMVVSLGSAGSVFCGICPHSFFGKFITKFGLKKSVPKRMQNPLIGLGFLLVGYWLMLYIFPGVLKSPIISSIFFLFFTLLAFVSFFVFKDMSYCKYFCPIGSITSSFSKVSPTWLATYQNHCVSCEDFACAKACPYHLSPFNFDKKNSMQECKLCMECANACEAVGFFATRPSNSLFMVDKNSKHSEIWTFILIAWVASISMILKNALGNSPIAPILPWNIAANELTSRFGTFSFDIAGTIVLILSFVLVGIFSIGNYFLASKIYKINFQTIFQIAGYSIAPLVIFGGMAQTLPFFLTHYGPDTLNALFGLFNENLSKVGPFVNKSNPILKFFAFLHFFGIFWGIKILKTRVQMLKTTRNKTIILWQLSAFHILYFAMIIFTIISFVAFK